MHALTIFASTGAWFVISLAAAFWLWKKIHQKEPTDQTLDSSYRRLRQEGKKVQGEKRKSKYHSRIIRNSFLVALACYAFSCASSTELTAPQANSCAHEYLMDKTTQEEWCRLCGHQN